MCVCVCVCVCIISKMYILQRQIHLTGKTAKLKHIKLETHGKMEEDQVHLVSFVRVSNIILTKLSKALKECLDAVLENKKRI